MNYILNIKLNGVAIFTANYDGNDIKIINLLIKL